MKPVDSQGDGRPLPATHLGPKPGDFPIGSLESRAAARSMLDTMPARQCVCFPTDEPPDLALKAEIEAAKAVRCPIHGNRFGELAAVIYVAAQFRQPTHLNPERWKWHSPQYKKAMDASFPPDRWPAQEIVDSDGGVRFVLKDGTEIHRISPPALVYDLDTGMPCGRIDRNGTILPLSPPTVEGEGAPPKKDAEMVILDFNQACRYQSAFPGGPRTRAAAIQHAEELWDAATDPTPAQTGEEEVSPRKKDEGYEIFDLP